MITVFPPLRDVEAQINLRIREPEHAAKGSGNEHTDHVANTLKAALHNATIVHIIGSNKDTIKNQAYFRGVKNLILEAV